MQQLTLARQAEFQRYTKKTRREQFLDEMEAVMPWVELQALVEPYYSKGETGRKPVGLGIMLRVYFLQQWFALSDPGVEDALYESSVLRRFTGVDLGRAPAPDETTILNFRHLLEEHDLCGQMLDAVNHYLESRGIRITTGTPALSTRRAESDMQLKDGQTFAIAGLIDNQVIEQFDKIPGIGSIPVLGKTVHEQIAEQVERRIVDRSHTSYCAATESGQRTCRPVLPRCPFLSH